MCLELREERVVLETGDGQDLLDYRGQKVKKAPRVHLVHLDQQDLRVGMENGVRPEQKVRRDLVAHQEIRVLLVSVAHLVQMVSLAERVQ